MRKSHIIALCVAAAVLLAGVLTAALLAGREEPRTPAPTAQETDTEPEAPPAAPHTPVATIADDTLTRGQSWEISITFPDEALMAHFRMHGVAFLKHTGDTAEPHVIPIKMSMLSSLWPSPTVPSDAPYGTYDLYVSMENWETEGCAECGCDSVGTVRLENFLTIVSVPSEDYEVTATLYPNVFAPGETIPNEYLSITVTHGGIRYADGWSAEMRLRGAETPYAFPVWPGLNFAGGPIYTLPEVDVPTLGGFYEWNVTDSVPQNRIPADAPEGFYDLVVTLNGAGEADTRVIPNILLVTSERIIDPAAPLACYATTPFPTAYRLDDWTFSLNLVEYGWSICPDECRLLWEGDGETVFPLDLPPLGQTPVIPITAGMPIGAYTLIVVKGEERFAFPQFLTVRERGAENLSAEVLTDQDVPLTADGSLFSFNVRVTNEGEPLRYYGYFPAEAGLVMTDDAGIVHTIRMEFRDLSLADTNRWHTLQSGEDVMTFIPYVADIPYGTPTGTYDLVIACNGQEWIYEDMLEIISPQKTGTVVTDRLVITHGIGSGYNAFSLLVSNDVRILYRGEAWAFQYTLLYNNVECQDALISAYLSHTDGDGVAYGLWVDTPNGVNVAPADRFPEDAPAGTYDLIISYENPTQSAKEPETYTWTVKDILTVIP